MTRRRKLGRFVPERVAEVIDAGAVIALDELVALIRSTNPTRRELAAPERARRYALKARLQSAVLRHHADRVEVAPTAQSGVVAIRLLGRRGDAGHAVIDALDPDVRPNRGSR